MCDPQNSEEDVRTLGARDIRGCKPFPLPSHAGNELTRESELLTTELLQTLSCSGWRGLLGHRLTASVPVLIQWVWVAI